MTRSQGLWACVYKGVEDRRVMEMQTVFCVWKKGEKSWNIRPNETNISLKILNKKCNKN